MEKLSMCRICLAEDGLRSIVDTHLHEMYESLVICPFDTKDRKPIHACYICCARLQNCYDLRKSCLHSEELFEQMLSCDEDQSQLVPLKKNANRKQLSVAHPVLLLGVGVPRVDPASDVGLDIKPPKLLVEVKDENVDEGTADRTVEEDNVNCNIQTADSDDDVIITNVGHLEQSTGTADRTVEGDNVNCNIQTVDSDDDVIITNVGHLEESTDINMPMKSSLAAERSFEDSNFSELKETPVLTVKVEVEDMKEIELIESISSLRSSDGKGDAISLGTQQTILETPAHIVSDPMPLLVEPLWVLMTPVANQTTVESSPRISARLAAEKCPIPSLTVTRKSRLPQKGRGRPLQSNEGFSKGKYEKLRRNDLKKLIDNLKQLMPEIKGKSRPTQARILQEATDLCKKFTQQEIEKEKLRIEQKQLATRLEELLKPA